jgi:NADH-quinone oxidoreductase subunit A
MQDQFLLPYIPVAVLLGIALFFAILLPVLSLSLGPRRPTARKSMPYESGMTPIGEAQRRLPVRFYRVAVLFILFDVDIILLVPYALVLRELGLYGLSAFLIFMVVFILGDLWVWKKGVLEWE